MTNATIQDEIIAKLELDPRIPDAQEIEVILEGRVVTLRGTVGSFAQRRAATADARATDGVVDVFDEIKVRLMHAHRRQDKDIRVAALRSLGWDAEVPAESLEVAVDDGWVTLTGDVDFQFQSDKAFADVASLTGVTGVTNTITITQSV